MPKRLKRDVTTEDLLKSDSDDENYDDHAVVERSPRKSRKTTGGGGKKHPHKKTPARGGGRGGKAKKSRDYDSEDEDEIEDSEVSFAEEEEASPGKPKERVVLGRNGRPKRGAAVKAQSQYAERSDDDDESIESSSSDDGEEVKPRRSAANKKPSSGRSLVVVLKLEPSKLDRLEGKRSVEPEVRQQQQQQPPRRVTRATSATPSQAAVRPVTGGKGTAYMPKIRGRGVSAEPSRRSSRLTHTDEPMAALSNSGKHVVVTLAAPVNSDIPEEGSTEESREQEQEQEASAIEELLEPSPAEMNNGQEIEPELEIQESEHELPQDTLPDVVEATAAESISRDDTGHEADEDEDEGPSKRIRTRTGTSRSRTSPSPKALRSAGDLAALEKGKEPEASGSRRLKKGRSGRATSRKAGSDDEDYHEDAGEGEHSDDSMSSTNSVKAKDKEQGFVEGDDEESSDVRNTRNARKRHRNSASEDPESQAELQAELEDLQPSPKRPRRTQRRGQFSGNESGPAAEPRLRRRTQAVDYRILRPEMAAVLDDNDAGASTPSKRKAGGVLVPSRSLFDTNGPFGGGGVVPFFGRTNAPMDIDSDSSDDDAIRRRGRAGTGIGGMVGMTPTGAHAPGLLPGVSQTHNADALQAGAPANLGKVTKSGKNALADADPLGVSPDVTFDSVGGLDDRIQQLKEMVMLPLMYPEIFKAKKVVPPRGVLFHGPPGTGKTLLARAVASSFTGADGKKVTFYMRKGADCLSKWVGEAERQLRLLFDEARANQPSIIFFDEIDGLAPVRSSKQEQIHASIVSTLLALMDGMDGRGQVVVIGATNRPDAVDPALRRPGRFDREFYFPLPTTEARRAIIEIHSKGWEPPLSDAFKDQLASLTKGYGGADLRALCTEAALNAMQRTYPQIYKSLDKLKVDPTKVVVTARDFMMSLKKIIPSSERSTASGASPLPEHIKPLLAKQLERIKECLRGIFPDFKRLSPLEEAEYEDDTLDPEEGFEREMMMENFETARVYRPRLLIHGTSGLGQQYIAAAVLHFMEKAHVQSFDLGTLLSDATRTPETAIVQFFTEIKRHKPSIIFLPNIDVWYRTLPTAAINTFKGLLQSIAPNDRVLLFGISEVLVEELDEGLTRDLFGYSKRDRFELERPDEHSRFLYFERVMSHIRKSPREFPQDPRNRKKRKLPELERAPPPPPPRELTVQEKEMIARRDRQTKNQLKIRLNTLMENLKQRYRRFKKPVFDHEEIIRLLDPPPVEHNPNVVESDIQPVAQPPRLRPYLDENQVLRVEDTLTQKVYYNMDLDVIEERFSNGWYHTHMQFLEDVARICHDAKLFGDKENQRKANEMLTNAEVYMADLEQQDPAFVSQCLEMQEREKQRAAEKRAQMERKRRTVEKKAIEEAAAEASTVIAGSSNDAPILIPKTPAQRQIGAAPTPSPQMSNGAASDADASTQIHPASNRDSDFSLYQTPAGVGYPMLAPSQQSTQLTQMGSGAGGTVNVTKVGPMELSMIVNDASTTTSGGKRTSDGTANTNSQPHSNPYSNHSNGVVDQPQEWGLFGILEKGDSQLPATQVLQSSQGSVAGGSGGAVVPGGGQYLSQQTDPSPAQIWPVPPPPTPILRCDEKVMKEVHTALAQGTSGYTVEQLEQVNAVVMDVVWKSRSSWNRDEVAEKAREAFKEVDREIKELQRMLAVSGSFD